MFFKYVVCACYVGPSRGQQIGSLVSHFVMEVVTCYQVVYGCGRYVLIMRHVVLAATVW